MKATPQHLLLPFALYVAHAQANPMVKYARADPSSTTTTAAVTTTSSASDSAQSDSTTSTSGMTDSTTSAAADTTSIMGTATPTTTSGSGSPSCVNVSIPSNQPTQLAGSGNPGSSWAPSSPRNGKHHHWPTGSSGLPPCPIGTSGNPPYPTSSGSLPWGSSPTGGAVVKAAMPPGCHFNARGQTVC